MSNPIRFRYWRIGILFLIVIMTAVVYYVNYGQIYWSNVFVETDPFEEDQLGINKPSLTYKRRQFLLHGRPIRIVAGELHYHRVPPQYWLDRLLRLRAAGCNAVTTAAPWNLHEESKGSLNFEGFLDVRKFLETAQKVGLKVIFKVGPYIGSQLDFGGLPAWLLADANMKVRSLYMGFTSAVDDYFKILLNEVASLQAARGGPIVAFQLESDYASYGDSQQYLHFLQRTLRRYGCVEATFTSDRADGVSRGLRLPDSFVGVAAASVGEARRLLSVVQSWGADLPPFVSELVASDRLPKVARQLLVARGASVSFRMFQASAGFGFVALPPPPPPSGTEPSPVAVNGHLTGAYLQIRQLLLERLTPDELRALPPLPREPPAPADYGQLAIRSVMKWDSIVDLIEKPQHYNRLQFMEEIGQNFGFVLYRSTFKSAQTVTVDGRVADRGLLLVNSAPVDATASNAGVICPPPAATGAGTDWQTHVSLKNATLRAGDNVLDLLVENLGRASTAAYHGDELNAQRKGVAGSAPEVNAEQPQSPGGLLVNGRRLRSFRVMSLDFRRAFLARAGAGSDAWTPVDAASASSSASSSASAPALYRAELQLPLDRRPSDTFVDTGGWTKGVVFVNGFNVGRYWSRWPQRRLYLPATVLRRGANDVQVFELHKPAASLSFRDAPAPSSRRSARHG